MTMPWACQVALVVKNPPAKAGNIKDVGSVSGRKAWQPTPVFLLEDFHGQKSLTNYRP